MTLLFIYCSSFKSAIISPKFVTINFSVFPLKLFGFPLKNQLLHTLAKNFGFSNTEVSLSFSLTFPLTPSPLCLPSPSLSTPLPAISSVSLTLSPSTLPSVHWPYPQSISLTVDLPDLSGLARHHHLPQQPPRPSTDSSPSAT